MSASAVFVTQIGGHCYCGTWVKHKVLVDASDISEETLIQKKTNDQMMKNIKTPAKD